MNERVRWTDARLDDRFETITSELRALRDVPSKLVEMRSDLQHGQADTNALHSALRELRDDFAAYVEEQHETHEAQRIERKSDRRWMIGAVFTAAGLVIAAMSVIAGQIA